LYELVERRFGTDILFMTKYVDDSLFFIHKRIHGPLLNFLNGFYNRIKFEYENECNNRIHFLDIFISRLPDRLIFKLFQKPTHTGRIIHYDSVQPFSVKFNTAVNLRNYYQSSSDLIFRNDIQKLFSDTLHHNGYPAIFIDSISRFQPTPKISISKPK